jgi:four helix bundle protein
VREKTTGFKFENLIVWQKAIDLSADVHKLTSIFPKEEIYILTSQIKRAADSVALNIAEGSTGQSDSEFNRFLGYALRSNIEVVSCLYIGQRRELIDQNNFDKIYKQCHEIMSMINSLRYKLSQT